MAVTTRSIIVLGAEGMLGQSLTKAVADYPTVRYNALPRGVVDVTDRKTIDNAIKKFDAQVVVNAAAMTDVDGCERDPMLASAVNAEGARNVALACMAHNALLVHVSTDFVFDGAATKPYSEADTPNPICVYGATKFEGERQITVARPRHIIVRASWTFGPGRANFITKALERAQRLGKLDVVRQTGSPTYTMDVARGILALAFTGAHGLFHVANAGSCSRAELAKAALELSGKGDVPVTEVDQVPVDPAVGALARRPAYSVLDTSAFAAKTGITLPPWRDALAQYLKDLKAAA